MFNKPTSAAARLAGMADGQPRAESYTLETY
jgi:hypothetical protein